MWWTILSWTHTSFLLEVRQRLQHITFYIDILQFSINENYDKHKKRSCMEVPYSFMTCPGIEPGFTPWEGVVLTAWPTGRNRGDKIRTCDLCVPNAALYQTEPRLDVFKALRFVLFTSDSYIIAWHWKKCKRFFGKFQFFEKKLFRRIFRVRGIPTKPYFIRKNSDWRALASRLTIGKKNTRKVHRNRKNEKKHENLIQRSIRTLWSWRQILNASICKQYEDAKIIFQYSLLYRTVVQAIDGTNKKAAAFLLLRQPQKEEIYIVNVFETKGRDRQNALPVKYEKVYLVPGLLSCYALQDTGKMCRNIVFDVKKLWNRCRIECSPGRKLLFSGMSFLEWKFRRERRRGGSCRSRLINL